jgi:hypothetical protein
MTTSGVDKLPRISQASFPRREMEFRFNSRGFRMSGWRLSNIHGTIYLSSETMLALGGRWREHVPSIALDFCPSVLISVQKSIGWVVL